jgi:hypothetical protein
VDNYNIRASRCLADYDISHRFVASYIDELPIGRAGELALTGISGSTQFWACGSSMGSPSIKREHRTGSVHVRHQKNSIPVDNCTSAMCVCQPKGDPEQHC